MNIGFITCQESILKSFFPTTAEPDFISPELCFTPDDYLAVENLRAHSHTVSAILWGTPPGLLKNYDLIIMRSPWDYMDNTRNKENFMNWLIELEAANLPVQNPPALMRWLLDKHYLLDFANRGIRIIPTRYLKAGSKLDLADTFSDQGAFVVKQCISAGGAGLYFIDSHDSAKQHQAEFNSHLQHTDYMLQPFIPEIKTHGEWSLIFLGGKYSHSILKKTAAHSIMVHAERGGSLHFPVTPSNEIISFAEEVYRQLPTTCSNVLYLRIDIIETANGPTLVECEGVEPELFFRAHRGSENKFRLSAECFQPAQGLHEV